MEVILGIQQSMASAGLMLGPLIGTGLYSVGGFSFMFIALGLNFFAFVPYACWVLPKDKPYMKSDAEVKITDLLRNFGVMSVGGILVIAMLNLTALAPVLTEHLASYGVDRALAGLFFTIPTLTYSMCIVIISKLPKTVSRVKILVLGLFMSFLAMVFIGPWEYIGLPRNLIMVVFGLLNLGIGMCLCILPCLPIMVKKAQYDMPYHNSEHVSDAITSLTLFCFFSGQILGPPLSGLLREKAGFDNGFVILGLISLIYAVFFTFASKKLTSTMMPTLETPLYQEMVTARRNEIVLNEDL